MKKINSVKFKRFKESAEGKEAIHLFERAFKGECTPEEILSIAKKYNEELFRNIENFDEQSASQFELFHNIVKEYIEEEKPSIETAEDIEELYVRLLFDLLLGNFADEIQADFEKAGKEIPEQMTLFDIPQKYHKAILGSNIYLTFGMYTQGIDNIIPNLFVMQFALMKRFALNYEIELPETPNRSDYASRNLYYLDLCAALIDFFIESGVEDMPEICAYLFAYEFPEIKGELESEHRPMPEKPEQIWLLVGEKKGNEKNMTRGFWQGNALTRRGDLCLFYEKSPVKAMNAAWIAQEDGVVDPFFHYYSNTYIGNRIEFPAISFDEFINNEYFTKRRVDSKGKDLPGNYVKKHFQDCSGWAITRADYEEIQRMLAAKGYDVSQLPQLPNYEPITGVNIRVEADVTKQIVMPLLDRMGYVFKKDYFLEVEFTAGHAQTGYGLDKRPDVCLHMTGSGDNIGAQIVIEMKLDMSSPKKLELAFNQGLSYAKYGEARVLCLADQAGIYVFKRQHDGKFELGKKEYYKWEELSDNEKYMSLKRLFERV